MRKILIVALVIIVGLGGAFLFLRTQDGGRRTAVLTLDPQKETTHLSKARETPGVYWVRAFNLFWNEVERQKGRFDWFSTDQKVKEFSQMEVYPLVIIDPFANWDQDSCHLEERYIADHGPEKGGKIKVGKPCDMNAYVRFLERAVERYDGDGENDMPGLTIPIKYWEIMNEPSMQGGSTGGMGEELKFFVGTPQEYLEILKTSYETIKRIDPEAKVAHAGMAGVQEDFRNFWTPIFEAGGANYTDIANIHTISTDEQREDLYVIRFKRFIKQFGLGGKPIWITEVQFGELVKRPEDLRSFEVLMAKSSVFALALGADKLFYVENWLHWNGDWGPEPRMEGKREEKLKSSTHKVYLNLVEKINDFDRIETIREKYIENPGDWNGASSQIGQYKFISGTEVVYVLWGKAPLPAEIFGRIKVTDIWGESRTIQAKDLVLSNEPVFVE